MSRRQSAGLLMYRLRGGAVELFLAHPGGPFFANRDEGSWSVPKGLIEPGEDPLDTARREFEEETGRSVTACAVDAERIELLALGWIVQRGGKRVHAWGFEGEWPEGVPVESNRFALEYPRGSGRTVEVPEIDRAEFFSVARALEKINPAQIPLVERLLRQLADRSAGATPARLAP